MMVRTRGSGTHEGPPRRLPTPLPKVPHRQGPLGKRTRDSGTKNHLKEVQSRDHGCKRTDKSSNRKSFLSVNENFRPHSKQRAYRRREAEGPAPSSCWASVDTFSIFLESSFRERPISFVLFRRRHGMHRGAVILRPVPCAL